MTFKQLVLSISFGVAAILGAGQLAAQTTSAADANPDECNAHILTFPAWYNNISTATDDGCELMSPADFASGDTQEGLKVFAGIIALNILEIMIQLVAYICSGFIIYGGFRYMTSAGDSGGVASGKKTVLNAIIGLVLSIAAVIVISFISGRIGAQ